MVNEISGLKPLFENKIISEAEDIKYLESLPDVVPNVKSENKTSENSGDFYIFYKEELIKATTPEYRKFLKESGYADIDNCSRLEIAKNLLRIDQNVLDVASGNKILINVSPGNLINGCIGNYVVNLYDYEAKILVHGLGYKLLTTQLMYNFFIPYLKNEAVNNQEIKKTLEEMINEKSEFLEDKILDKSKLKIGTNETDWVFIEKDGYFDKTDLNQYGYPNNTKNTGEYYYWYPRNNIANVIRTRTKLGLEINNIIFKDINIGLRLARFV